MIEPAVDVQCEGPVHTLTLNRPARRNALDLADRRELLAALRSPGRIRVPGDHADRCGRGVLRGR